MATIYTVEIVSHSVNYPVDELQKIIEDAIKKIERPKGNIISIQVVAKDGMGVANPSA